jgi:hypothetical protein
MGKVRLVALTRAAQKLPITCITVYIITFLKLIFFLNHIAKLTTGLKWAPEM